MDSRFRENDTIKHSAFLLSSCLSRFASKMSIGIGPWGHIAQLLSFPQKRESIPPYSVKKPIIFYHPSNIRFRQHALWILAFVILLPFVPIHRDCHLSLIKSPLERGFRGVLLINSIPGCNAAIYKRLGGAPNHSLGASLLPTSSFQLPGVGWTFRSTRSTSIAGLGCHAHACVGMSLYRRHLTGIFCTAGQAACPTLAWACLCTAGILPVVIALLFSFY